MIATEVAHHHYEGSQGKGDDMKSQSTPLSISLGLLALLAMPVRLAAQDQNSTAPRYTVTDLGTLGGTYSLAIGINNAGKIAGAAATPDQTDGFAATAYLWTKQKGMIDL